MGLWLVGIFVAMMAMIVFGGFLVEIVDDLWRFHPLTVFALAFAVYMLVRTIMWLVHRWFLSRHP